MNQQLYNQLLGVASVIVGAQKFDEARAAKRNEWETLSNRLIDADKKVKNAHRSYGKWTGWGVFMMIFGFGNLLLAGGTSLVYALPIIIETFVDGLFTIENLEGADISILHAFFLTALILLAFACIAFLGIIFFVFARIKRKKYKKKAIKEHEALEAELLPKMDKIEKEIAQIQARLEQFVKGNEARYQFLPSNYRNHHAVGFMLKAVENLRADTLRDVINLYEHELHMLEQERILQDAAEMQRIQNASMLYTMESIERNQKRMNSNLEFMQAMQFISMMDD